MTKIVFGSKHRIILISSLVVGFFAIGCIGSITWLVSRHAKLQPSQVAVFDQTTVVDPRTRQTKEGSDKAPLPVDALNNYKVAASLPRALYISKINVAARILPMSVNPDDSVQAPLNINDSGWYNGSVKPGGVGAMFIDGHSSGATREGLFGSLDELAEGDTMQVEKGDGTRLTYKVVHTETVDRDAVDMHKMMLPYGNAPRGLNLMTCSGTWVDSDKTLTQRVLVFTEQVS